MSLANPKRNSYEETVLCEETAESLGDSTKRRYRRSSFTDLFNKNTGASARRRSIRRSFKDLVSNDLLQSHKDSANGSHKRLSLRRLSGSSPKPSQIDACECGGGNALHSACRHNRSIRTIHKIVLDFPDAVEKLDNDLKTPLHYAAEFGNSVKVISFLLTESAKTVLMKDSAGKTPLHLLCENSDKLIEGELQSVQKMVNNFQEVLEVVDNSNQTPLHVAAKKCSFEVIEYLVQQNENAASMRDIYGKMPLHNFMISMDRRNQANMHEPFYCANDFHGVCVVLALCVAAPMSVMIVDKSGKRPLEYAIIYHSHNSMIEELKQQTTFIVESLDKAYVKRRKCRQSSVLRRSIARIDKHSLTDTASTHDEV